ncbi:MAG: glycine cleavage system aminomethyltransferase GcvT, partial [Candidatus Limnocylindria bacterium]
VQYTSIIEEHRTVRSAVGLFDLSHMDELEVSGEEAVAFLRHALVSDAGTLKINQAQYSMACDVDGGIIDDLIVYRRDDHRFLVVCNASNRAVVADQLTKLLMKGDFGASLDDRSDRTALLAPQGPSAASLLGELTDIDLDAIGNYRSAPGVVAGVECMVARTGYTGEDGFELFCDARRARELWVALAAAGHRHGAKPCGLGARDTLRLEAGMPLYGNELGRDTNPFEVNLGRVVKLDKGDFVGRAALQAVQQAGPSRKLIGLQMVDNAIPRAGYEVRAEGAPVGHVTSGTLSPTLGTKIAMALVSPGVAGIGNSFEVVVRERPYRAEQVKLPFYKRPRN